MPQIEPNQCVHRTRGDMWQCSPEVPWPRAGYAVVGSIVKMDRLAKILESARSGHNQACKSCARNPKKNTTSFARNCDEHFGVKQNGLIIIARDPGASDGGSSQTGKSALFITMMHLQREYYQKWPY